MGLVTVVSLYGNIIWKIQLWLFGCVINVHAWTQLILHIIQLNVIPITTLYQGVVQCNPLMQVNGLGYLALQVCFYGVIIVCARDHAPAPDMDDADENADLPNV